MINNELLIEGGKELGLNIDEDMCQKFSIFKDTLLEWNEKMNLTGITEEREIIIKHFIDSLSCILAGVIKEDSKVLDLGTGAGFPGIPLKIYFRDLNITLLDSLNKRIIFLEELCNRLNIKAELIHGRAEELGKDKNHRERYDVVVSRAVADLRVLSEYCLPFVKLNGYFIAQKGPDIGEEVEKAKGAINILGGEIQEIKTIPLPFSDILHTLVVVKKVKETPKKYPRKAGTPAKNPL